MILTLAGLIYLGMLSYDETTQYNSKSEMIEEKVNIYNNIKLEMDILLKNISFELLGGEKEAELKRLNYESQTHLTNSQLYTIYYFLLFLIIASFLFFTDKDVFSLFIATVALISLSIAVITPILLLIVKTNDMSVIGEIVLQYEIKTIIGVIIKLFSSGNYPLFVVLLFFSILIPFIKSLLIFVNAILQQFGRENEIHNILKAIGKWSMVDVFVVAVMVVLYTVNDDVNSEMVVESGLHFFLIYVIVSMVSSYQVLSEKRSLDYNIYDPYYDE
jgi:paraquat-inducible protein A